MAEQLAFRKPVYLWINNGEIKIFTVPTWQTQDTDLIGTVLLDLRCRWMTVRCSFSESHTKRYKSSIFELTAICWRPQLRSPTVSFLSNPGSICTWHRQRWALRNFALWYREKQKWQDKNCPFWHVLSPPYRMRLTMQSPFPACEAAIHALVQAPCLVHRHVVLIRSLTRAKRLARWVRLSSHDPAVMLRNAA